MHIWNGESDEVDKPDVIKLKNSRKFFSRHFLGRKRFFGLEFQKVSKLYYGKYSILNKMSVYSWPKNVAKQQHFGK